MRSLTAAAAAACVLSFASVALPCGPEPLPVVADPGVGNSSGEAQRLLRAARDAEESARREESAARNADTRAASLQRNADLSLARATQMRGRERSRLLAQALSFEDAAIAARTAADRGFTRAADLRQRAGDLRDHADALLGGSTVDPWRRRAVASRQVL